MDRISPLGPEREDLRTAYMTAHIIAALTGKEQRVADCILTFEPPEPRDWRAVRGSLMPWVRRHNRSAHKEPG